MLYLTFIVVLYTYKYCKDSRLDSEESIFPDNPLEDRSLDTD